MSKNDEQILELKKKIEEKKQAIKKGERFSPVTNCSLELDGVRVNINVLTKDQIIPLLVKLNVYKNSAKELGLLEEYAIAGFSVEDWITDLQARLAYTNRKAEENRLRVLEDRLTQLLSDEKKVELELGDIAASLKE